LKVEPIADNRCGLPSAQKWTSVKSLDSLADKPLRNTLSLPAPHLGQRFFSFSIDAPTTVCSRLPMTYKINICLHSFAYARIIRLLFKMQHSVAYRYSEYH
jgi:hypothetical protein